MELKKNPKLDYRKKYGLFFNIGLVLSLALVISAFEMKFAEYYSEVDMKYDLVSEELDLIQITEHKPPPKPKIQVFKFIEVKDEIEIDEPKYDLVIATGEPEPPIIDDLFEEPKIEDVDVVHDIVEKMPSFDGGLEAFYRFISKDLKYPAQARRMGIEGKVFVHFIVDKDGSLSDIKVVRGIGSGCDEEVLRVINKCPKWNPGKQRGDPVRVRMMLPITFRLD